MEQSLNNVNITGVLVKNGLEVRNVGEENECISGSLILRTADGSEHEVSYFANKYKKDENKNFTSEEGKMYTSYETIMNDYISLEQDKENADVIKIGQGEFKGNDFISKKDKSVVTTTKIKATFANRLNDQEKEVTPQIATFSVSGVITKLEPEIYNQVPTGNGTVMLDIIGYGGSLIPVKLTIPQPLVEPFGGVGFFETGTGKLNGNIINVSEQVTTTTKQAFGADLVETKTNILRRNEVCGGSPTGGLEGLKITHEEYVAAQSKRRLKLEELKNKDNGQQEGFTAPATSPFGGQPQSSVNPFGQPQTNPFGQ